ncbi:MAG TPA: hypothetical protein VN721_14655 [Flavipsychrobacter sp.]|nr:hypothetical protein [Flavipsychrobacter sp.]
MRKNMRNAGLVLLAAGILVYPSMLLYRTITKRMSSQTDEETDHTATKEFAPSYRGKRRKHRHADAHTDHQQA